MRGCFLSLASSYLLALAFPAYAGMFLRLRTQQARPLCFPRVCGDVSFIVVSSTLRVKLSPRMRGCFFRDCSLCRPLWLSPRMRGCFSRQSANARSLCAFPAYAGMFPCCFRSRSLFGGFPRVCGDVSETHQGELPPGTLSPRMRGCFQAVLNKEIYAQAFPAYAGMFLQSRPSW